MNVITSDQRSEQLNLRHEISAPVSPEDPAILELVDLAKDRANNGRKGDRALQKIIELQQPNIKALIRKRRQSFPLVDQDDMELAAIESIVCRLESYDPLKGKLGSWLYFGIMQGLDRVCRDCARDYKAKKAAEYGHSPIHTDSELDEGLWERVAEFLERLPETAQEIITLALQGFSYVEIGRQLGKSADACRMAFNRGVEKIKSWLFPVEEEKAIAEPLEEELAQPICAIVRDWVVGNLDRVVRIFQGTVEHDSNENTLGHNSMNKTLIKIKRLGLNVAAPAIAATVLSLLTPSPASAQFSLLLNDSQQVVNNCVFDSATDDGWREITDSGFNAGRIAVFGFGIWNLFRGVTKKRRGDDEAAENFAVVFWLVLGVLAAGVIEPAFADPSCGGGGGGASIQTERLA